MGSGAKPITMHILHQHAPDRAIPGFRNVYTGLGLVSRQFHHSQAREDHQLAGMRELTEVSTWGRLKRHLGSDAVPKM